MSMNDFQVERAFQRWIDKKFTPNAQLPDGFEYVDHDDPDLLMVTDGVDNFIIEYDVMVCRNPERPDP